MKQELITAEAKEYGLEEVQAKEMTKGLDVISSERKVLIDSYNSIIETEITKDSLKLFKELRLKIRDNRTKGIDVWHKTNKEYFLAGGRFIDSIKRKESAINKAMEEKLSDAENHFVNIEKEKREKLQKERLEAIRPYVQDPEERDYTTFSSEDWVDFLDIKKSRFLKIQKEEKEEEERVEAERLENERLAKEEAEKEAEEKRKLQEEKQAAEEKAKKLQEEKDAAEKKALEEKQAAEDELRKVKEENNRLAKEKQDADNLVLEQKKKEEIESVKAAEKELKKGDREKFTDMVEELSAIKEKYFFESDEYKKKKEDADDLIGKTIAYITK